MTYPEFYELCHNSAPSLGTATLSSGVYSCSTNALPNGSLTKGALYSVRFGTANDGACSLKVNNAPAYSIRTGADTLRKGDITANKAALVYYDGQYIQLVTSPDMLTDTQMKSPLGVMPAANPQKISAATALDGAVASLAGQLAGGTNAIKSIQSGALTVTGNVSVGNSSAIPASGYLSMHTLDTGPRPVISGNASRQFTVNFSPLSSSVGLLFAEWHSILISNCEVCSFASSTGTFTYGSNHFCYHELDGMEVLTVTSGLSQVSVTLTAPETMHTWNSSAGAGNMYDGRLYILAYSVKWKLLEFGQGA